MLGLFYVKLSYVTLSYITISYIILIASFSPQNRTSNASHYSDPRYQHLSSSLLQQQDEAAIGGDQTLKHLQATPTTTTPASTTHYNSSNNSNSNQKKSDNYGTELRSTKSFSSVDDTKKKKNASSEHVEVFLGGSCNPTTWRADVAIPALKELGISFYNPVRQTIEFIDKSILKYLIYLHYSKYPIGRPISLNWSIAPRKRHVYYFLLWIRKHAHLLVPSRRHT